MSEGIGHYINCSLLVKDIEVIISEQINLSNLF